MNRILAAIFMFAIFNTVGAQSSIQERNLPPPHREYVADEATAITIAIAVLSPIYGADTIKAQCPFTAMLNDGVWTIVGNLSPGALGGVAEIKISKANGMILRVSHGK